MEINNLTKARNVIQLYIHSTAQQVYVGDQMECVKEPDIENYAGCFF